MSGVGIQDWYPDEPVNSRVISALVDAGLDAGRVTTHPDHTWSVEAADDFIVLGFSFDDSGGEVWDATRQSDDELIESGDLTVVAATVAQAVKP